MDSMPPATTISDSPVITACAARATAFSPEPHTLLMVIAATSGGSPPPSAACRAGACPSPAETTLPMMHSSTCFASLSARRTASATTFAPSCVAEHDDSPPWNLPTGVRTALKMTAESMAAPLPCCISLEAKSYARSNRKVKSVGRLLLCHRSFTHLLHRLPRVQCRGNREFPFALSVFISDIVYIDPAANKRLGDARRWETSPQTFPLGRSQNQARSASAPRKNGNRGHRPRAGPGDCRA